MRVAYITSLESQISSLRDELATVYKTQGQNAQRLLAMTETLREKEEFSRIESESVRKAREEIVSLRRKVDQHNELMSEKDRTAQVCWGIHSTLLVMFIPRIQILHDEINTLQLELGQIEERNQTLTKDTARHLGGRVQPVTMNADRRDQYLQAARINYSMENSYTVGRYY